MAAVRGLETYGLRVKASYTNPLKSRMNLHSTHKDSVVTPLRKLCASILKTQQLILYREATAVYCRNHKEHTKASCG